MRQKKKMLGLKPMRGRKCLALKIHVRQITRSSVLGVADVQEKRPCNVKLPYHSSCPGWLAGWPLLGWLAAAWLAGCCLALHKKKKKHVLTKKKRDDIEERERRKVLLPHIIYNT